MTTITHCIRDFLRALPVIALACVGCSSADSGAKSIPTVPQDEKLVIHALVESYFLAPVSNRTELVHDVPNLNEQMAQYYEGRPPIAQALSVVVDELRPLGDDAYVAYATVTRSHGIRSLVCYARKRGTTWRVDWQATVGFNPTSVRTFRATSEKQDTTLRVYAQLSDYYNYQFRDNKHSHYSIELSDVDDERIHGFVEKDSQLGKDLFSLIADGRLHELTVVMRCTSDEGSVAEIVGLRSRTWIID